MLEGLLSKYNTKQVVGDLLVRKELINYLDNHDYPHKINLDFLKKITKVGHSILKFDKNALTENHIRKLIEYSTIAINMLDGMPKKENSKKYSHMHSHLHSHLGQLFIIQYNKVGDFDLLKNAIESESIAASLSEDNELTHAFHSYKRCAEYNKVMFNSFGDKEWILSSADAFKSALLISEQLNDIGKISYSLFHLGMTYRNILFNYNVFDDGKNGHKYFCRLIKDPELNSSKKIIDAEISICNKMFRLTRQKKWQKKASSFNRKLPSGN